MDLIAAMRDRHAVRDFTDQPLDDQAVETLRSYIAECNTRGGMHIQLITGQGDAFAGCKTHYGRFRTVHNCIAIIGPDREDLATRTGYWGELLALQAQQLGLNSCWVVLDDADGKGDWTIAEGERLLCLLAIGYGTRQGIQHRTKPIEALCDLAEDAMPDWFRHGMEAAQLAPTSLNQQPFLFSLDADGRATVKASEGLYANVGVGTAMRHFEIAAGPEHCSWCEH